MAESILQDALEHLVTGIVNYPEDVQIETVLSDQGKTLEVRVNPADLGRVIGKQGRNVKALRTVLDALSQNERVRIDVIGMGAE